MTQVLTQVLTQAPNSPPKTPFTRFGTRSKPILAPESDPDASIQAAQMKSAPVDSGALGRTLIGVNLDKTSIETL